VLIAWCVALVPALLITLAASRAHLHEQERLSVEWYARGDERLRAGDADAAVEAFRTALAYSREEPDYRHRLAQALIAAGRSDVARTHLLALWERQPGRGVVNLELARMAAGRQDVEAAVQYYQQAVHGAWEGDAAGHRRTALFELARLLLARGRHAEARIELLSLAGDLPNDPGLHVEVGGLLLEAQAAADALAVFERALRLEPRHAGALAGAGRAAFTLARYGAAEPYLRRAVAAGAEDVGGLLAVAREIRALDPQARGLSSLERARRVARLFALAVDRLERCAPKPDAGQPPAGPAELHDLWPFVDRLRPRVRERLLRNDPELTRAALDVAFDVAGRADARCGPATAADQALVLIGRPARETGS
jgi:tetratricopeptide (TPR) repeat protein